MLQRSRREILKQSLAAGAAVPLSSGLPSLDAAESVRPLRAAVIGCGGIASHHARVNFAPHFDIRAICDVDRQRSEAFRPLVPQVETVVSDYRELLQKDEIDVIFVCTPDHWHSKITVDALRSGKDAYCEKPLTFSVDEGRLIQRVLSETGRVLQVGTQQRSDLKFQTAVALARSGRVGKVQRVTVAIGGGPAGGPFATMPPPESLDWDRWLGQAPLVDYLPQRCHGNFRWWYEYSGGKLTDWGAHHVDIAMWALGDLGEGEVSIEVADAVHPVPLVGGMPSADDCYNTANRFRILCRFESGVELVIRDNAPELGFENGILFQCEKGRFFVNRNKLTGKPVEKLAHLPLPEEDLAALRRGRPVMSHMESFARCCRERTLPVSDAESHIRHLNLCHLGNIAMRLGRDLRWNQESGVVVGDEEANRWLKRTQRRQFEVV